MRRRQEVDRDRPPDQCRADRRQQRQEGHQHAPQQRALHAEEPEGQPADDALRRGHGDVALDGGADHGGELVEQVVRVRLGQRQGVAHDLRQVGAVAQQEEQQVQHDAKLTRKSKVFWPMLTACVAIAWLRLRRACDELA